MKQPGLRATLYLTALAAACHGVFAQTSPALAPDTTARTPNVALSATYAEAFSLASQIAAILAAPGVSRDHWGIQVTTLDGTPIYSLNEAQLFQPASNAKLFTTAAALVLLGQDTAYETKVVTRGVGSYESLGTGTIANLVLVGGGDANLSDRTFPYKSPAERAAQRKTQPAAQAQEPLRYLEQMADQVAAKGVKVVDGDVIGDDSLFPWEPYPSDWSIDDTVWGYGAPVSALSINDNQLQVTVGPGPNVGGEMTPSISFSPATPYYALDVHVNGAVGKQASSLHMDREPGSKTLRIYGSMAADANADVEQIAIQDPAEFAAIAFKSMLEERGIVVHGIAKTSHSQIGLSGSLPGTTEIKWDQLNHDSNPLSCPVAQRVAEQTLASHTGPSIGEDIVLTNKVSQNLHAELLLHHLGKLAFCEYGSTEAGLAVVRAFLIHAGLDANDFVFYDGSGLSGHDLVTPRATAKLLAYAAHDPKTGAAQPWFAVWKSSLPVGGEDGTLASRFGKAPLKDHLFAKTGTLGEARALSGYLDAASGRTVIFSIFVGNHLPGTSDDRDAMDRIVAAIQATQ